MLIADHIGVITMDRVNSTDTQAMNRLLVQGIMRQLLVKEVVMYLNLRLKLGLKI
jgi:hypothetical protein